VTAPACMFAFTDADEPCPEPPVWHMLVHGHIRPHTVVVGCNVHYAEVGPTQYVLAAHRYLPTECGRPDTAWNTDANRCTGATA
jgi:hypothetical protein